MSLSDNQSICIRGEHYTVSELRDKFKEIQALREKNERLEKIIHAWLKWDSTEALEGKEATQKAYENFVCLMREYIGLSNEGKSPLVDEPIPELTLYSQLQRQLEEARGFLNTWVNTLVYDNMPAWQGSQYAKQRIKAREWLDAYNTNIKRLKA